MRRNHKSLFILQSYNHQDYICFFSLEIVTTTPTIGFNVETVKIKNITFTAWDVGGAEKIGLLWRHYFHKHVRKIDLDQI